MLSSQQPLASQTPVTEPRVQFPSPFILDAVIDGQAYPLPQPDEPATEILLLDGSLAQLLAGKVMMHGQTLNIPSDSSRPQPISGGGQSVTIQPGKSTKPDADNHNSDSGGGVFGFLGKAAGAMGSAAKSVGDVATGAASFAAGTGGVAAGTLARSFSTATGNVGGVISTLNGIQQAFPLTDLTKTSMSTFLGAQNLGRSSLGWMQSVGKTLEVFDNLKPDVQQKVRDNMREISKPGGTLEQADKALKAFSEFPWEEEVPATKLPTPTATQQPTESAKPTRSASEGSSQGTTSASTKIASTTSSSSSSATATPTEGRLPWFIATKRGTSLETFTNFIQKLDGGNGTKKVHDTNVVADFQTYQTNLTSSQADGLLTKYPFLLLAYADVFDLKSLEQEDEFHAIPQRRVQLHESLATTKSMEDEHDTKDTVLVSRYAPLSLRALLPADNNAPYWKKMISSPFRLSPLQPPSQDPPYLADDSGGRGTTIYVLDNGFDIGLPVGLNIDRLLSCCA
jgi:hypothetical protein